MGARRGYLAEGERVVVRLRTHGKVMIGPAVVLFVVAAVIGLAVGMMPTALEPGGWYVLAALGSVAVAGWVLVPFLRWRSTTYTLTTRRIILRTGLLSRRGHDLPLDRIHDVRSHRSLTDRMLGCGTLLLQTAADADPLVLPDVPEVQHVQRIVSELVFGEDEPQEVRR